MPTEVSKALATASWSCCAQAPGAISDPVQLDHATHWLAAQVPGTAASALRDAGQWDMQHPHDLDAQDWWYRTTFANSAGEYSFLCFDGLATLAEVWLNGEKIFTTDNMFRHYRINVAGLLREHNELVLGFRSLTEDLKKRRPRPRWKTNLVSQQQLRWQRTSLLGRIPGWSPPVPAVGPWKDIRLECGPVLLSRIRCVTSLEGMDGKVSFEANIDGQSVTSALLVVGEHQQLLECTGQILRGQLLVPMPDLWWPHTHGPQPLLDCKVMIEAAGLTHVFDLERISFRKIEVLSEPGFAFQVNGERVYCRGACWTACDIFTLSGSIEALRHDLMLARDAGINMLRVGGTMTYESDAFYRLCDELGIMVWQDFMFANMDYPIEDSAFSENITQEALQQLGRLAPHPCVVAYCGNSEIEQQAAMLGMPRELWRNRWFGEQLPTLCAERHPGTAYLPSTPSGGVLPFHVKTGITHYYGVGAYLRSTKELRQADVKFTTECLGFANIPEPETIDEIMGGLMPVMHHPRWKQRIPRDTGAGWDFEDVRDHYLRELFSVDPVALRSFDMPRYLELSRLTSGEMMARTVAEWRSAHSNNAGGLIWFYKDLWAAAGWGIIDHRGIPKAAYYQLRRMWQPRQLTITDEGLDGLDVHLVNETAAPIHGFVEIQLLREPNVLIASHEVEMQVQPRSNQKHSIDEILGSFFDVNYAYRFGPRNHHIVIATWFDSSRSVISESCYLTQARDPGALSITADNLEMSAESFSDGRYEVTLTSDRFLHHVRLYANGFLPDDNYFHLPPSRKKRVIFTPIGQSKIPLRAYVEALNMIGELAVPNPAV